MRDPSLSVWRYNGPVGVRGNFSGRCVTKETTASSKAKAVCNIRYQIAQEAKVDVRIISIDSTKVERIS